MKHLVFLVSILLLLAAAGCQNPLSDGKSVSEIVDKFRPGPPIGKYPHRIVPISGDNQPGISDYPVFLRPGIEDIHGRVTIIWTLG
jgi:hypothetical protein